ncbi:hypothetical protein THRCLA_00549 [Thraustotheca clavata]|uniref:Secreted protein n=1 Tax=Thraustotheca clavata TaxID=74557 RepID=A0A1W0AAX4_9STRA|nr:hypothetical protein THRCLA_00549 [Thraustotheca clavata]
MFRFIAGTAVLVAAAPAQNAAHYNKEPTHYGHKSSGYDNDGYGHKSNGYGNKGYKHSSKITFPPAYAIIDPGYYTSIFTGYQKCISTKCDVLPSAYSASGVNDCISTIAGYTSCVTACASAQAFETVEDFRNLLEEVIVIGQDQLRAARIYLSGLGDLDVIGERVHIGESCCLPNSYFASWERIMIPVEPKLSVNTAPETEPHYGGEYNGGYEKENYGRKKRRGAGYLQSTEENGSTASYMMSAADYVKFCSLCPADQAKTKVEWYKTLKCDDNLAEYLQSLQRNIGHLILAPSSGDGAPDGACCNNAQPNPRAVSFPSDVCIATTSETKGKTTTLTNPLIKSVDLGNRYVPCPSDEITTDLVTTVINYERVSYSDLKYYTVTTGLPSSTSEESHIVSCQYNQGFVKEEIEKGFFVNALAPFKEKDVSNAANKAARLCPTDGLFEYCNVDQYATFLERQLFDHSTCDISELRLQNTDYASSYQTVACLYKIFSLKCDCMEAVLSCYNLSSHFASSLTKVIGQAASILCGFILCQRPNVYSLFGEEYAIDRASIMRELLTSTGILAGGSISPAATVFLSFGIGMIALLVTKKVIALKQIKNVHIEDGYQNLI